MNCLCHRDRGTIHHCHSVTHSPATALSKFDLSLPLPLLALLPLPSRGAQRAINEAGRAWGIECLRYEIRDISPPAGVRSAMEMQAEAERRRRAQVLESEGEGKGGEGGC